MSAPIRRHESGVSALALAQDEGDFRQDILQYSDFVRSLALALVRDPNAADDLFQSAMARALESPPKNRSENSVRAFFRTMMRRDLWRGDRDAKRALAREKAVARPEAQPDVLTSLESERVFLAVTPAIETLPSKLKSVVTRTYIHRQTSSQIASDLNIDRREVRERHDEGLEKMREKLDREFRDRDAWRAALIPLCLPRPEAVTSTSAGTLVAASAAIIAIVGVGIFFWVTTGSGSTAQPEGAFAAQASPVEVSVFVPPANPAATSPVDAGASAEITGTVVDEATGNAIDGVRIVAVPTSRPIPRAVRPDDPFAITDRTGQFRIPLRPESHDIVFEGNLRWSPDVLQGVPSGRDVRLELAGASTLIGAVRDSDGGAVRSGVVEWAGVFGSVRLHGYAEIASNGTYELLGLPSRDRMADILVADQGTSAMRIVADGFSPTAFEVIAPWPGDGIVSPWTQDVVLTRSAELVVDVVDDRGKAVPNADVSVIATGLADVKKVQDLVAEVLCLRATTDASGRASFDVPTVGSTGMYGRVDPERAWGVVPSAEDMLPLRYRVEAWSEWHGVGVREPAACREGEHVALRLVLTPGRRVIGRCVYADGMPAVGVDVRAFANSHPGVFPESDDPEGPSLRVVTDEDGTFVFESLPVSSDESVEYHFEFARDTLAEHVFSADPSKAEIDLGRIELERAKHARRRLRVLDASGLPLGGAAVLPWTSQGVPLEWAELRTDADGIAWFPPEYSYMTVRARGHAVGILHPRDAGDRLIVDIQLARELVITGTAVWASDEGESEPYALRAFTIRNPNFDFESPLAPSTLGRVVTDSEGRFRIDQLPEGRFHLVPTDCRAADSVLEVSTTEAEDLWVVVPRADTMAECRVDLRDAHLGEPIHGAVLRLYDALGNGRSFAEIAPGVHVRGGLTPGHYEIDVRQPEYVPERIEVEIEANRDRALELDLEPSSRLIVNLYGAESELPTTLFVRDIEHGRPPTRFERNPDGDFVVTGILADVDHRIELRGPGSSRWVRADARPLRISTGDADRDVRIEITRGGLVVFDGASLSTEQFEAMGAEQRALHRERGAACDVEIVAEDGSRWYRGSVETLLRIEQIVLPSGTYQCLETLCGDSRPTRTKPFRIDLDNPRSTPRVTIGEP